MGTQEIIDIIIDIFEIKRLLKIQQPKKGQQLGRVQYIFSIIFFPFLEGFLDIGTMDIWDQIILCKDVQYH